MKFSLLPYLVIFALVIFFSCEQPTEEKDSITLNENSNPMNYVSYSLGISIAKNLKKENIDSINIAALSKGLEDHYNEKELLLDELQAEEVLDEYFKKRLENKLKRNLEEGLEFLEKNKTNPGVVTLASGLQYQIIKEGTGGQPTLGDKVTTHYHGTLIDGTVFDSSVERNQPATFGVNGVIDGWTEALQLMTEGSKWKLFIPSHLAYGENSPGGVIEPNMALIFEVELLTIHKDFELSTKEVPARSTSKPVKQTP